MLQDAGLHFNMTDDERKFQQDAMFSVLRALCLQGLKWQKGLSSSAKASARTRDALREAGKAAFLSLAEVDGRSKIPKGQLPQDRYILIKPPERETATACAVSCAWDFKAESPIFGGYLGIWTPSPKALNGIPKPIVFIGYRFETPDHQGTKHKFFHSQPCRSMDQARRELPIAVNQHDVMPTIPLKADQPADLLINLAISLHGRDYISELAIELGGLQHPRAPSDYVQRVKQWFGAA